MIPELDTKIDVTMFATSSPGEGGAGVIVQVTGKPNVSKGGQIVVIPHQQKTKVARFFNVVVAIKAIAVTDDHEMLQEDTCTVSINLLM